MARSTCLGAVLAPLLVFALAGPPASGAEASPFLGWWKKDGAEKGFLAFEEHRVAEASEWGLFYNYANLRADAVDVWTTTAKDTWKLKLSEDVLRVTRLVRANRTEQTYRRLKEQPPELRLEPSPVAENAEVTPERIKAVRKEIASLASRLADLREKVDASDAYIQAQQAGAIWLEKTVAEVGWIDSKRFGKSAAKTALQLTRTAPLRLQVAGLPHLEREVRGGVIDASDFASFVDLHLVLSSGRKQRYGTLILPMPDSNRWVVLPIEDRANVDARRRDIGLGLLSEELYVHGLDTKRSVSFFEWN